MRKLREVHPGELREVHPGVPLLNRQFEAVVHRFAVLQNRMQNYKDDHAA